MSSVPFRVSRMRDFPYLGFVPCEILFIDEIHYNRRGPYTYQWHYILSEIHIPIPRPEPGMQARGKGMSAKFTKL